MVSNGAVQRKLFWRLSNTLLYGTAPHLESIQYPAAYYLKVSATSDKYFLLLEVANTIRFSLRITGTNSFSQITRGSLIP
jgi:hypothetical protein